MATKFDTDDYKYECVNCDDVFQDEKTAKEHEIEFHTIQKEKGKY